ncbi:MAG: ABC transporter permease [Anaerolineae bacterium]
MLTYVFRRVIYMIVTLFLVSVISFVIIQLPPGDFVTSYIAQLAATGQLADESEVAALRARYGLDKPIYVQYTKWMGGVLKGDLGRSLSWNKPVMTLIKDRLPWSFSISLLSFAFVWAVGLPIGVYSATHQYSAPDYIATFLGFVGLGIPNFLLALVALWLYFRNTGQAIVGLFSPQYIMAPWSLAKLGDLLRHLWIPALITGTAGTAGLIRTMRANLLDELRKPYVMTGRAKGLPERRLLFKYPFRVAMIPAVSTIGWVLPGLFAGELLVSFVLGIPTLAPIFLGALLNQDMFLAGSVVLILSALTVVGTLISDLLLAWVDPRIRESV